MKDSVRHMSDRAANLIRKRNAPCFFKFFADFRNGYILIARIGVWKSSHVAGSLHVVLSADRTDAHGQTAEVSGHQRKVGKSLHNVYCLCKLTDSHTIKNHGRFGGCVHSCRPANGFCRNMRNRLCIFRSVFFYYFQEFVKSLRVFINKLFICQTFIPDHICHGIYKSKVRTALKLQMNI